MLALRKPLGRFSLHNDFSKGVEIFMSEDFLKLTEKVFKETARCSFVSDRHLAEVTNFFKYFLRVRERARDIQKGGYLLKVSEPYI